MTFWIHWNRTAVSNKCPFCGDLSSVNQLMIIHDENIYIEWFLNQILIIFWILTYSPTGSIQKYCLKKIIKITFSGKILSSNSQNDLRDYIYTNECVEIQY